MNCMVVATPTGPAFVCGTFPKPKPCHFCGGAAPYLCDWPVLKPVKVAARDVQLGEKIRWFRGDDWTVVYRSVEADAVYGELVYLGIEDRNGRVSKARYPAASVFVVNRPATCDNPCCDSCARQPAEDVHHCQDHWHLIGSPEARK
ncbi:MAG TPA: hypothetical protein VG273_11935 [Bryobacteraceae bacterium]|jgi:hypothetical protein|nr:hypothetical protein [Bryobacteraceae bacterium]